MKLVLIKESFRFPPHLLHSLKLNESRLPGPGQVLCPLRTIFHLKPLSDAPAPLSPRIPPYEPSRVLRPGDSKDIYTRLIKKSSTPYFTDSCCYAFRANYDVRYTFCKLR